MNATVVLDMLPSLTLCMLMVGMLSYLGIHVIKREIIFVDLALAQIAALGALIALCLGIPLHTHASYWFSMALTAVAALLFTLSRSRDGRVPQEAVIGLVYAIAAAVAMILIDKAPHGAQHIKDILTGSILWVEWGTVALVAAVYALVALFHFVFRGPILQISQDAEAARRSGLRVGLWDFLFYLSFGFVITVSVGSAGVLLVFVFLVAPAAMAVLLTDRLLYQLLFGWVLGVTATIGGLAVSYAADLSAGPLIITAYGVALLIVAAITYNLRSPNRVRSLTRTVSVALAFGGSCALLYIGGRSIGRAYAADGGHHLHETAPTEQAEHSPPSPSEEGETDAPDLMSAQAEERQALRDVFAQETDPLARADVISRAIDVDVRFGAALALEFLALDPPPFFAQSVTDQLNSVLPEPCDFDVAQPFASSQNQAAAASVRSALDLPAMQPE